MKVIAYVSWSWYTRKYSICLIIGFISKCHFESKWNLSIGQPTKVLNLRFVPSPNAERRPNKSVDPLNFFKLQCNPDSNSFFIMWRKKRVNDASERLIFVFDQQMRVFSCPLGSADNERAIRNQLECWRKIKIRKNNISIYHVREKSLCCVACLPF